MIRVVACLLLFFSVSCTGVHLIEVPRHESEELYRAYVAKEEAVVGHLRGLLTIHERTAQHMTDMFKTGRISQQDLDKHLAQVLETKIRLADAEFRLVETRATARDQ